MTFRDRTRRPSRKGERTALTLALLTSLLAGCASPPPADPVPEASPTLSQEQQDDRTFEDLFTRYANEDPDSDAIVDDLPHVLTGDMLQSSLSAIHDSRAAGERTEGKDEFSGFEVTDRGLDPQGVPYMTAQVCLDVSGTRIIDASGNDITPSRDPRLSLQVKAVHADDGAWRISDMVRNEDVHACG